MNGQLRRLGGISAALGAALLLSTGTALAHTGEDASSSHVMVEFGLWALGVGAVLAAVVLVFWLRSRLRRRSVA